MKVYNSLNWTPTLIRKEVNNLPSKTVPDQSMTVRELMVRQSRGIPLSVQQAVYHDEKFLEDETGRNPGTMDISEIVAELKSIEAKINAQKEEYLKKQSDRRKEAYAKAEQLKREKWIKEFQETNQNPLEKKQ